MPSLKFSVPYNNDPSLLEEIKMLKNFGGNEIEEIYFSGPKSLFGSGRAVLETTEKEILKTLDFCKKNGFRPNLLLNSTCEGIDWYSPIRALQTFRSIKLFYEHGLERLTIANPLHIKAIKEEFPEIDITASVLSQINSPKKAAFFNEIGCRIMIPDRDLNRDLGRLKEIKESGDIQLKIMVNEGCLFQCPYRSFHFNLISHISTQEKPIADKFFINCRNLIRSHPSEILKSCWINPENIGRYSHITKHFKITGRTRTKSWITHAIKAYMSEDLEGNLLNILDSSVEFAESKHRLYLDNKKLEKRRFFDKVLGCSKNCTKCGFCEDMANELIVQCK